MTNNQQFIGEIVCGYRIIRFLGEGGMGEVYLGQHQSNQHRAAIKFLNNPDYIQRFQNEALIQAEIRHPGIARFYHFDVVRNTPCIVMEYVEGLTLKELILRRGKLAFAEAKALFTQIVEAVAYLHQNGIIHRDIKPSNVKITPQGKVKLLDFGIAKSSFSQKLTQTGEGIGTIQYMSLEQLGGKADTRSDVWSLGVLFYEMLTGYLPFNSKQLYTFKELIRKGAYTSVRVLNGEVPPHVEKIVRRCLRLKTESRYADAGELLQALHTQPSTRILDSLTLPSITLPGARGSTAPVSDTIIAPSAEAAGSSRRTSVWLLSGAALIIMVLLFFLPRIWSGFTNAAESDVVTFDYEVRSFIPNARIEYEGKVYRLPRTISKPRGTELRITVKASGYDSKTVVLSFNKNDETTISLNKK